MSAFCQIARKYNATQLHNIETYLSKVRTLSDRWAARAADAERSHRLHSETLNEIRDSGLLDVLTPARFGGLDLDWWILVECGRIAAKACASTAWTIALVGGHSAMVARFPERVQQVIYADGPAKLFSTVTNTVDGQFIQEKNGYRISGTWRFCSNIDDADWILITGPCINHPAPPEPNKFMALVRKEDVKIIDTWQVSGMCATASKDIVLNSLFVPDDQVAIREKIFAQKPYDTIGGYIHRTQLLNYTTSTIIGPLLGCMEGAFDAGMELLKGKAGRIPQHGRILIQDAVTRSSNYLDDSRRLYHHILNTLHEFGHSGRPMSDEDLMVLERDRSHLATLCFQTISILHEKLGTMAVPMHSPFQRHWRDLQVICTHMDLGHDRVVDRFGHFRLFAPEAVV